MKKSTLFKQSTLLLFALLLGFGTGACEKSEKEGKNDVAKIGVPECDEYVEKYSKCVMEKVPEASREQMKQALDQMAKSWKDAAQSDAAKEALASGCKQALEQAKQSMTSFGCEF